MKYSKIIFISALMVCVFVSDILAGTSYASLRRRGGLPSDEIGRGLIDSADLKHKDARQRAHRINVLYNRGRSEYASGKYLEAKRSFEEILELDNSYEPAKLFLESVVVTEGVFEYKKRIEDIKMQMSNIMSEYDKRVQRTNMLAAKYFLELAQKECQLGNFQAAENYYNLCYKIHPQSKDSIEWFVRATHDLMVLYSRLDEENRGMEELIVSFR